MYKRQVLKYTKFGRSTYAIGGNIEAAKLSGITVNKNKILIYVICGCTAAITGIILASRMFSGQPSAANGMELDAIAACVIGGTSTTGGKGRLWGTFPVSYTHLDVYKRQIWKSVLRTGENWKVFSFWAAVKSRKVLRVVSCLPVTIGSGICMSGRNMRLWMRREK